MPRTATNDFSQCLVHWFERNQRDLPWRKTYDPYCIWISEIMLQQTQMERGVSYFERWVQALPDPAAIAAAPEDQLLKLWEGLGYYSRVRNIKKAATRMLRDHEGRVPDNRKALLALPGIGPYTAGAILSIAYKQDEPLVDGNVARVLCRVYDLDAPIQEATTQKNLWALAKRLLPKGQAREFNQGLMELGALVCTPRSPRCECCPVARFCESKRLGITKHRPVPGKRINITPLTIATGVLVHEEKAFIQRRVLDDVWGGLWEFPGGEVEQGETPRQAVVREFAEETGFAVTATDKLATIQHGYTRFRVTLHCYALVSDAAPKTPELTAATEYKWTSLDGLDAYAFPAGHRKLIDALSLDPSLLPTLK